MEASARPYWAAEPDIKKLIPRCMERFAWWMDLLQRSGRWAKMRSTLSAYYGSGIDGRRDATQVHEAGEDGETLEMHTNQVRPIVTNVMSLIAGVDPVVRNRARNADAQSLAATRLANGLIDSYAEQLSSKERELDAVRGSLLASSWNLGQSWSPRDGKEWATGPDGQPIFEGDMDLFVLPPWRCVHDFAAQSHERRKWVLFRRPVSRFDTAAQLEADGTPESAERAARLRKHIEASETTWRSLKISASIAELDALLGESLPQEDVLWVWELRHVKTPALPEGRLVRFVEPDIKLWDSLERQVEYPYKQLHVFETSPESVVVGAAGHTSIFDLGALQEFIDICTSSIASTTNINGMMHFWSPEDGIQAMALQQNATIVSAKSKPEPMMWPALAPGILEAAQWAIEQARQSAALNNVVMGQPDKGMPASAQALQRAQAQQYHAVAQGARLRLRQRNINGQLQLLQRFAETPRTTAILGAGRKYEMKQWRAADLADVEPFDVMPVDPYSASFEGREAMLEKLLATSPQLFADQPDALLTYVQTGSVDAITQTQTARRELVESNVELLRKGVGPPPVDIEASLMSGGPVFLPAEGESLSILKSDPHHLAIPAYLGVLASPASRADPAIMKAAKEAVELSMEFWAALTPDEAMCFGIPPLPSQMAMAAPPPMPGEESGMPEESGPSDAEAPAGGEAVKLPAPPENPLTGDAGTSGETGLA